MTEANVNTTEQLDDVSAVQRWEKDYNALKRELNKVIVGQERVIEQMLIAIMARGHCLLEGAPGLAKTLMISSLSEALRLDYNRIQFTPDLMPSDITGTDVLQEDEVTRERKRTFVKGPIFTNMLLADEINRTPPKTQAAMLEGMQERVVSSGGVEYKLPDPFFVLATQNPLEQEGTYPLPEAQLDRFLLYIKVDYPTPEEEWEIARRYSSVVKEKIEAVVDGERIIEAQQLVKRVPVCEQTLGYAWALVRASRPNQAESPDFINQWASFGAGPRGVLALLSCAQARSILYGRFHATIEDVQAVAAPALRHRIAPNYAAMAAGKNSEALILQLLKHVPADKVYKAPVPA